MYYYRPQTKFVKVMFLQVCVSVHRGGSMHGCGEVMRGCQGGHVWLLGGGGKACVVAGRRV